MREADGWLLGCGFACSRSAPSLPKVLHTCLRKVGLGKGKKEREPRQGQGLGSGASRPALLLKILPFMLLTSEKIRLKCAATQLRREK